MTLYHVLAIVASLILAALLIRGAQRLWRRVSTWHLYALILLGSVLLLVGCGDSHQCGPVATVIVNAADSDAGTGSSATQAAEVCGAPECTAEVECTAWGEACCVLPYFAICVSGTDAGHDVCGCNGFMPPI